MQVLKQQLHVLWEIALRRPTAHLAFLYDENYRKMYDNGGSIVQIYNEMFNGFELYEKNCWNIPHEESGVTMNALWNQKCKLMPSHLVFCEQDNENIDWTISWGSFPFIKYCYDVHGNFKQINKWKRSGGGKLVHTSRKVKFYKKGKAANIKRQEVEARLRLFIEREGKDFTSYDEMKQFFWENNK